MRNVVVTKEFSWAMGHRLTKQFLPEGTFAKCRMPHGHNYKVQVTIGVTDDNGLITEFFEEVGMVYDFTLLKPIKNFIDNFLDHRFMIPANDTLVEMIVTYSKQFFDVDTFQVEGYTRNGSYATGTFKECNFDMYKFHDERITETLSSFPAPISFGNLEFAKDEIKRRQTLEILGGLLFVTFEPTAENMAVFFARIFENQVKQHMKSLLTHFARVRFGVDSNYDELKETIENLPIKVESVKLFETDKAVAQFINTEEIDRIYAELDE